MQNTSARRGFTLIELLVVVLIIGILMAVAVPKYQVAVMKSRVTQGLIAAKAVHDAQQVYYINNGNYASLLSSLDIELAGCVLLEQKISSSEENTFYSCANNLKIQLHNQPIAGYHSVYAFIVGSNADIDDDMLGIEYALSNKRRICVSNYVRGQQVCMALGGIYFASQSKGRKYYMLP